MPGGSGQRSIYLVGAQVGRDTAQLTWQKEVRGRELISEYRQLYFQEKERGKHRIAKI